MDPITAEIVAGVLWFFLGSVGTVFIYMGIAMLVGALGRFKDGSFISGVLIGWIAAVIWEAFVLIQVIIHAVNLVKLLT